MHGREACVAWEILRDMVNERAVRILLECILVDTNFWFHFLFIMDDRVNKYDHLQVLL